MLLLEILFNFSMSLQEINLQMNQMGNNYNHYNFFFSHSFSTIFLFISIFNIVVGAINGLSQIRIKRLLVYSAINHIGFILLCIVNLTAESLSTILFYIFQYSITSIDIFILLLCFFFKNVHVKDNKIQNKAISNIYFIHQINAQIDKFIYFIFSINIFSISGIPPIIGFFAKIMVLQISLYNGYYFIIIFSIITSIINTSYYLKIIQIIFFSYSDNLFHYFTIVKISNIQGFFIIFLTFITFFFIFNADL